MYSKKVCRSYAYAILVLEDLSASIPIALIDSYKVFNSFHFGPVTTQVHYLKPIEYDEYKDMKTKDIAALVKERIEEKIKEILG